MPTVRKIIKIDEERCDGCGLCVPACAEGAIQIIGGKARLVSEVYCDGLGACLGECPQGAITVEGREAEEFDPEAVERHLAQLAAGETTEEAHPDAEPDSPPCGCPGATAQVLQPSMPEPSDTAASEPDATPSQLGNWPVQIRLAPVRTPYFEGARLLIAADCVPFAFADFHRRFLAGRTVLVGCPKLDDAESYRRKLAQVFAENDIKDIEVVYMEVPCCFGLVNLVRAALDESKKRIPIALTKVGIRGAVCETVGPGTGGEVSVEDRLMEAMRDQFDGDRKRIAHAMLVFGRARELLRHEEGDPRVTLAAALLHDIGIREAERKHGSSAERYQEIEGPPIARRILEGIGLDEPTIEHVCRIVGNHHSAGGIDTPEFRIVWDADNLVNLSEGLAGGDRAQFRRMIKKVFKTKGGREKAYETAAGREEE